MPCSWRSSSGYVLVRKFASLMSSESWELIHRIDHEDMPCSSTEPPLTLPCILSKLFKKEEGGHQASSTPSLKDFVDAHAHLWLLLESHAVALLLSLAR